jgi:phosphate:Na+ symporter
MPIDAGTFAFAILELLGGLALFIYGMSVMSDSLQKTVGGGLRALLYRVTRNPLLGMGAGTGLGFLIHSSATTVMIVGFVNAGLMTLPQSVGVMLGANIGTTLSMQVVSINLAKYCHAAIAAGFLTYLIAKKDSVKFTGFLVFGFGLLFLGMRIMSASMAPLKEAGIFESLVAHTSSATVAGMLLGLLVSTAFTGIIQSSGATIGILFALGTAGVFTRFDQVFSLVLGAHIGTCATALLGCIGTQITAKRSAVSHFLFNVVGSVVAMLLYPFYAWLVPAISGDDIVRQTANLHTSVQLVNAFLFLPFTRQWARLVVLLTPSREREAEKSHLDVRLLDTPERAIVAALQELQRMARVNRDMFQQGMRGLLELDPTKRNIVVKDEEVVDSIKAGLTGYLIQLTERKLSKRQAILIQHLLAATNDLERIGDHVDSLSKITTEKFEKKIWFDDKSMLDLIALYKKADHIMQMIVHSFAPNYNRTSARNTERILAERNEYVVLSREVRARYNQRILEGRETAVNGLFFARYVFCFDKIVKHSKTIALVESDSLFFIKEHKLDRRSEAVAPEALPERIAIAFDPHLFDDDPLAAEESGTDRETRG